MDRLPIQDAAVIKRYNDFLSYQGPKAFAVSQDKAVGWALGIMSAENKEQQARDPGERAMANCRRRATTPCVLYAVDEQVVYSKPRFSAVPAEPAKQQSVVTSNSIAVNQADSRAVSQPAVIATGFANINDVDAIPFISDRGREGYREWLTKPTPRAFVISDKGFWSSTWGIKPLNPEESNDPVERALLRCAKASNAPCKLYAMNGSVVYAKDAQPAAAVSTAPSQVPPATK